MFLKKACSNIICMAVLLIAPVTAGAANINWATESYRAYTTSYVHSPIENVYDAEENFGPPLPVSAVARTMVFDYGCSHATSDITSLTMNVYAKACAGVGTVSSSYGEASFTGTFVADSSLFLFDYSFNHNYYDSSHLEQWITMTDLTDGTVFSNLSFNGLQGTLAVPVYEGHTIEVEFGVTSSAYSSFDTVALDINETTMNYSMSISSDIKVLGVTPETGSDESATGIVITGANFDPAARVSLLYGGPLFAGSYGTVYAMDVYVAGDYAYLADGSAGLKIINISDPSSPFLEGSYDTPGSAYSIHVIGNYAYVADHDSLQIINISDPSSPFLESSYDVLAVDVHVSGNYAYVTYYFLGMKIINISDPSSPFLEGFIDTGYANDVYVSGDYAYVADGSDGLKIINVSNPSNPSLEGFADTPGNASGVHVADGYAYVADNTSGLQIINISDPSNPSLEGSYGTAGNAYGVYVSGNHAYVGDAATGLHIINVSVPSFPSLVSSYDTPGWAYYGYVSGNYVYIADYGSGLQIVKNNGYVTNVAVADPITITATVPAGLLAGPYHILVKNPGGGEAYLYNAYTVTSTSAQVDYYCDSDGDTYINAISDGTCTGTGCEPQGCSTAAGSDCDDGNPAINPDTYWYQDYDGDGFGNASISLQQCQDPSGSILYVLDSNDYNDGDPDTGAPVFISGAAIPYYSSLQAAYDAASDGDTIRVIAVTFNEDLFIDRNISVTFECGYDGSYSTRTGTTTLIGNMTISGGTLNLENFLLQ